MVFFPKLFAQNLSQLPPIAPVVWLSRHLLGITHPHQAKAISAYNPVILILTLKAYLFLIRLTLTLAGAIKRNPERISITPKLVLHKRSLGISLS